MRELGLNFRLLMVALAATVVVLVAPNARAAFVPMCGEHAETIAAPPIIMPSKNLVLDRVTPPCSGDEAALGQAPSDAPRPSSLNRDDGPLRAWPTLVYLPSAPTAPAHFVDADVPALPAGFADSIYRPPRAA
jgi:hypothetical protein